MVVNHQFFHESKPLGFQSYVLVGCGEISVMSPGNWCGGLHLYTRRGAGHLHSRGSSSLWVGWHEVVHLCRGVSVPCCLIHVMSRKGLRRVQTQCPSFGPVATMLSCYFLVFHCLHRTAAESWWLIEKLYSSETEW